MPCGVGGCWEWTRHQYCYGHGKAQWQAGGYSPQSTVEKLWLWGGLIPEAKFNGNGWIDANDWTARAEAKFDASIAADIRSLAGIEAYKR